MEEGMGPFDLLFVCFPDPPARSPPRKTARLLIQPLYRETTSGAVIQPLYEELLQRPLLQLSPISSRHVVRPPMSPHRDRRPQ